MNTHPTVDVVTLLWKSEAFLDEYFRGLASLHYPRERITIHIIDNASPDGSGAYVKRVLANPDPRLPKIILHEAGENLGFAGGNNLIMKSSTADYVFLLNADAAFEPGTVREAVAVAEAHPNVGAVQSLMMLMQKPGIINSTGNVLHFAGFGYCGGYLDPAESAPKEPQPIAYASGGGVLYRTAALQAVGIFDETFFMYHEDLDLGWRMMIAGWDSYIAPKSILRHHFEFSRSIQKWEWMERNRWIVYLTNYHWATIFLTLPAMIGIEIATWVFAIQGGWWREKWRAVRWFLRANAWKQIFASRRRIQSLRVRRDAEILERMTAKIEHQETENSIVAKVGNPILQFYFNALKILVVW